MLASGRPMPRRRSVASRSRARRSNRRCPPGVVHASTRPSSAQRRSVSGSMPRRRLAGPSESQRSSSSGGCGDVGHADLGATEWRRRAAQPWGETAERPVGMAKIWVNLGTRCSSGRAEDRAARLGVSNGRRSPIVRRGRTRDRRDGCHRTGPGSRVPRLRLRASSEPGIGTGRMISRTSPRRQNR